MEILKREEEEENKPRKVKIDTPARKSKANFDRQNQPVLKRLQTQKIAKFAAGASPIRQKQINSPFKAKNFKQILSRWEELSTSNMTPVVDKPPGLQNFADSQSDSVLENCYKMFGQLPTSLLDAVFDERKFFGRPANEKTPKNFFEEGRNWRKKVEISRTTDLVKFIGTLVKALEKR